MMTTTINAKKNTQPAAPTGFEKLGDIASLLGKPAANLGEAKKPFEVDIELIDEDSNQPRRADNPGFSNESIAEIGESIKTRGVKSPISVREHPDAPGRFIINHGARRYRGSKWAGKKTIPIFVDNDYNEADQVVENIQRELLTDREIADFIGRELARGKKKSQIAREISKSPAYVTQHVTLLDLPEPIARAFNSGRCRDVTVVNEMCVAFKRNPAAVEAWLAGDDQEITRSSVKLMHEFAEAEREKRDNAKEEDHRHVPSVRGQGTIDAFAVDDDEQDEIARRHDEDHHGQLEEALEGEADETPRASRSTAVGAAPTREGNSDRLRRPQVQVKHGGKTAVLLIARRTDSDDVGWIKYVESAEEVEVELAKLKLYAIVES